MTATDILILDSWVPEGTDETDHSLNTHVIERYVDSRGRQATVGERVEAWEQVRDRVVSGQSNGAVLYTEFYLRQLRPEELAEFRKLQEEAVFLSSAALRRLSA